jgi:HNH endonuclease
MTSYVSTELRRLVAERAASLCEYCLIHESDTFLGCQVDHVISEKHGGTTQADNLAYACTFCNRAKGTDIGSLTSGSDNFVRFFNPRRDRWIDHFELVGVEIRAITDIGRATVRILEFNRPDRLRERQALVLVGRYPSLRALE